MTAFATLVLACLCLCISVHTAPIRGSIHEKKTSPARRLMGMEKGSKNNTAPSPDNDTPAPSPDTYLTTALNPVATPSSQILDANAVTYTPGDFSQGKMSDDNMINLSNGLSCKRIATSGEKVMLVDGTLSEEAFHDQPDGAAVFSKDDGGWYYVSNAESNSSGTNWWDGGVGVIEFDANGDVIGYKKIVNYLLKNCGGGVTPWNSWITCEEIKLAVEGQNFTYVGKVWQVDPSGERQHELTAMGELGLYESFAYDDSTPVPTFYVTQDSEHGALSRFTPNDEGMACYNQVNDYDRWCTLNHGTTDYLLISGGEMGTFYWTTDYAAARENARLYYPNSEGIDSADGKVFFVSKLFKRLVILDLQQQTYTYSSTVTGAFNEQPDQVASLVGDDESILYFCEDGGGRHLVSLVAQHMDPILPFWKVLLVWQKRKPRVSALRIMGYTCMLHTKVSCRTFNGRSVKFNLN
jgi:Bacterial protein of unknown function (DUF839)